VERDVKQRVEDELADEGLTDVQISYHLTSIFDHSIFEALSKVIQKLIPQLPTLQALLNNLTHVQTPPTLNVDNGFAQGVPVRCHQQNIHCDRLCSSGYPRVRNMFRFH
jgi:hypothetical protein